MTVLSRWIQEGFSYCHSNLNFWEQLMDIYVPQYHYGTPTHTGNLRSLLLYIKSWDAKDLLNAQEPTGPDFRWKMLKLSWSMIKTSWTRLSVILLPLSPFVYFFFRKSEEATASSASMVVTALHTDAFVHHLLHMDAFCPPPSTYGLFL